MDSLTRRCYRFTRTGESRARYTSDGRQARGRAYEYRIEHTIGGALHTFAGYGWGRNQTEALDDWRQHHKAHEAVR